MEYLLSRYPEEIENIVKSMGVEKYRAAQIFAWLQKGVSIDGMTNVPRHLRDELKACYNTGGVSIYKSVALGDGVKKYLFLLDDGNIIEGVFMPYRHGNTLCVSSQAGCAMGCVFCASTAGGLSRNLRADEMTGQVLETMKDNACTADGCRTADGRRAVSNIVIMGSGEPLLNYDEVIRFIRLITHEKGQNFSERNISLSTAGIVPGILALAEEKLAITLCVSLHAPDDALRKRLMPAASRFSIAEIMESVRKYVKSTGRRVSFEYILIDRVNDSIEHAKALAGLLPGLLCHVNLIPCNVVEESGLKPSPKNVQKAFLDRLQSRGIQATVRRELGTDADGACGQLRNRVLGNRNDD